MFKKKLLIATFSTGYVLGAKAGKERYCQIKKYSNKFYKIPIVKKNVDNFTAKTKNAFKTCGGKIIDKLLNKIKETFFSTKIIVTSMPDKSEQSSDYIEK